MCMPVPVHACVCMRMYAHTRVQVREHVPGEACGGQRRLSELVISFHHMDSRDLRLSDLATVPLPAEPSLSLFSMRRAVSHGRGY